MEANEVAEVEMPKLKPKKKTRPPDAPFGVRLSGELRSQVQEICDQDGVPLGQFIQEAVEERAQRKKPDLARRALFRSVSITSAQFERALEFGVLAGTEAEEQADEIRRFFGQLTELLHVEPDQESEESEHTEEE